MQDEEVLAYVKAAARAVGLPLDDAAALRVASQLARTAGMAAQLDDMALAPEDEIAEVFCPAPFPAHFPAPPGKDEAA